VDLTDEMDELGVYTPQMIERRVEVGSGDILILHTGWHRYGEFGATPDEEKYIHLHPGAHPDMVPWLLEKKIHVWGVDVVSTDHPMNLPIGRFLGKGMHGQCDRVRKRAEERFGGADGVNGLEATPRCDGRCFRRRVHPKLDEDLLHVEANGVHGQAQVRRDLAVARTRHDAPEDLALARREAPEQLSTSQIDHGCPLVGGEVGVPPHPRLICDEHVGRSPERGGDLRPRSADALEHQVRCRLDGTRERSGQRQVIADDSDSPHGGVPSMRQKAADSSVCAVTSPR